MVLLILRGVLNDFEIDTVISFEFDVQYRGAKVPFRIYLLLLAEETEVGDDDPIDDIVLIGTDTTF